MILLALLAACVGTPEADDVVDTTETDAPDDTAETEVPAEWVPVTLTAEVILPTNFGTQVLPLFRSTFTAGSQLSRMQVFARFCADAACDDVAGVVAGTAEGADGEGLALLSTASPSGGGFTTAVTFDTAPAGEWYVQLVGDTQRSRSWGKGACTGDCPGPLDVVQTSATQITPNTSGGDHNPPRSATRLSFEANASVAFDDTVFLGHLVLDDALDTAAPTDPGRLLVALSNQADTYRNQIAIVDLANASAHPGAIGAGSYVLQHGSSAFAGDVCTIVRGDTSLYAVGVGNDAAYVFRLDADGAQASTTPVATFPHSPDNPGFPCRGVWARVDGHEHLYLIPFQGSGALDTSKPHAVYVADVTAGTVATPLDAYGDHALRAITIDAAASRIVLVDMSWSKDNRADGLRKDRLISVPITSTGALGTPAAEVVTTQVSDDQCGSTNHWPSGATFASVGGTERLLVGDDTGITMYDASLAVVGRLDLHVQGTLFSQLVPSADGTRLYALPQCKSAASTFTLPYAAGTESADENLVAVVDLTGSTLALAAGTPDIDGDGDADGGIDLDFYRIKGWIRGYESTLPIPPVVYVGPQLAVGASMLFVRGTGVQGNGTSLSSSGMGQAQDVSMFDLTTGHGVVFGGYRPFFDGLSSEAGTGTGIWGYDVWAGQEASVGWVEYLPAP